MDRIVDRFGRLALGRGGVIPCGKRAGQRQARGPAGRGCRRPPEVTAGALAATVLEAVPVPVLILRAAGRIEFLNPTARRLLYRPGSWLQQSGDSVRRVGGLEAAALKALIREAVAFNKTKAKG